jgi:hypothetical protein
LITTAGIPTVVWGPGIKTLAQQADYFDSLAKLARW